MRLYVVTAGLGGTVVVVVVVGAGGEVVVGVDAVVVVVALAVGGTVIVVVGAVVPSVGGGVLVVGATSTVVVVDTANSAAVPAVGMAGTSVTWPRTDPTADAAIIVATMVATAQAATIPTRRIMPILCPRRPMSGITVR
jgi:hypothetical protein